MGGKEAEDNLPCKPSSSSDCGGGYSKERDPGRAGSDPPAEPCFHVVDRRISPRPALAVRNLILSWEIPCLVINTARSISSEILYALYFSTYQVDARTLQKIIELKEQPFKGISSGLIRTREVSSSKRVICSIKMQ